MNALIVILSWFSLALSEKDTSNTQFPTGRNGFQLTNLLVKDNIIYLAENGVIHMLNKDLSSTGYICTCDGVDCENINKVLTLSDDLLVLCGTGNGGICQAWNGSHFVYNSSRNEERDNYLLVSTDRDAPAVGLVYDGSLFLGVTYGAGIEESVIHTKKTYKYLVSRTNIIKNFSPEAYVYLRDELYSQYKVYFKSIFRHENFLFLLTNQLSHFNAKSYVSKLIRICLNETFREDFTNPIQSYTDIVLSCEVDGDSYNLVQDAVFLPSTKQVVAGFSRGENPEFPEHQSAVCVYHLDTVTETIDMAKKDYITCKGQNNIVGEYLYIEEDPKNCVNESTYSQIKSEFVCPSPGLGMKVISNRSTLPTSSHKLSDTTGRITKIGGVERYDEYPDIVYGTDRGSFGKITVDKKHSIYEYENQKAIDSHPVTGIHISDDDRLYILTIRKIFRLDNTNCSKFRSYIETLDGKNPSCGWCVQMSMSTKKTSCDGNWISSLSKRASMDVNPKFIRASQNGATNLAVTLKNLPQNLTNQLKCSYKEVGGDQYGAPVDATSTSNDLFQCQFPHKDEHVKVNVQMISSNFIYSEAVIEMYKCSEYESCEMCSLSPDIACKWCTASLTCQDSDSSCAGGAAIQGNNSQCPKLLENHIYIAAGIQKSITLYGANFINNVDVLHKCVVSEARNTTEFDAAVINSSSIRCHIKVSYEGDTAKMLLPIAVFQRNGTKLVEVVQKKQNDITVYTCQGLATDCTLCGALNKSRYACNWCDSRCNHSSFCNIADTCPPPQVTEVYPNSGGNRGGTKLMITVKDLGDTPVTEVKVGGKKCKNHQIVPETDSDFVPVNTKLTCEVDRFMDGYPVGLNNITVRFADYVSSVSLYSFEIPMVGKINPNYSSSLGGALITLTGRYLGIGNGISAVRLYDPKTGQFPMLSHKYIYPDTITCLSPKISADPGFTLTRVRLVMDGEFYESMVSFTFKGIPYISEDHDGDIKSTLSGGIARQFNGKHLDSTPQIESKVVYGGETKIEKCKQISGSLLECILPGAPDSVIAEMTENNGERQKRSISDDSIAVQFIIQLDNYQKEFYLKYYRDPKFEKFIGEETTRLFKSDEQELTIQGQYINLVGTKDDYRVYIGPSSECTVIRVTETNLTCMPPILEEQTTPPPVTVVLGNFNASIGYVRYVKVEVPTEKLLAIILPVVGGVLLLFLVFLLIGFIKYRGVRGKAMKFEKNLADMELQIKKVFREEFLDMHTTMSRVNESLIEKGFPYNNYQRYSFLMMFPGEWNMEEHPLMHEPVVSDHIRGKLKQGMDQFDELLKNKFFLVSIVSTMEKQKKFFLKEKSNMAGHLSVALLGKMEYVHEILIILLTNLVDDTPAKSQKTLFRRCESITEKLLSNWLVLSLYPHVKLHSGSPLYMLLKGTQLTMESGPIDALTGDSKYTLSEDKLLRQDDKPNTLTLKIMVDNSDEIRDCKVLDCDTISQVKAKCLSQIYVNYPASQLTVESSDLNLEWHWGTGGRLMIQDEDTTSKREGQWLRLNTLDHYKVTDGSSMALVDPHGLEQEDYVNLANIRIDSVDPGCNGSVHSNDPLTPPDEESGLVERWHLVKPDSDQQKPESFVVEELYLNRLITTKQSVLEYMKNLFDTILSSTVPPPTKFLFDFLDELGEKNKVESDTLHAWKSQCYTIRFWATLINKPYNLFDQRIPSYVETSMEVISQVLIESCSLKAPEYTKDSSPGKLIFKKDMVDCRDKVKQYYTQVKTVNQDSEDLRLYLKDLNKFQQQQLSFNRQAALYSLYAQLQPYMDEIMEDLESNEETKSLHLDRKLATLNNFMQED